MSRPSVNSSRSDPYSNFNFRVSFEGRYVAGAAKVGGLSGKPHAVDDREDASPTGARTAGQSKFNVVTLEQGVTYDADFQAWVSNGTADRGSLSENRKDLVIELLDESGEPVCAYNLFKCWVSRIEAIPDLNANANEVAIQSLTLECEGLEQAFEPAKVRRSGDTDAPARHPDRRAK